MNNLTDLIQSFEKVGNWKDFVFKNFERKSGLYSYATVTDLKIEYNNQTLFYPTKINLEYGYTKFLKDSVKVDKIIVNKKIIIITERKKIIPFSFYKREGKYTGEIFEILSDIIGDKVNQECLFSSELLTFSDNPLYSVDSKLKWPSFLLVLQKQEKTDSLISLEQIDSLSDILTDYGIHYDYSPTLKNVIIVVFPMPYLKVVENKIRRNDDKESIFIVLEFNQLPIFYTTQLKIEIDTLIKDVNKEIIHQRSEVVKFDKAQFQMLEIFPEKPGQISYASITVKINGITVDRFSGYYIRDIKLDIKIN